MEGEECLTLLMERGIKDGVQIGGRGEPYLYRLLNTLIRI